MPVTGVAPSLPAFLGGEGEQEDFLGEDRLQKQAKAAARTRAPLRAVFMGTPDFAAAILEKLLDCPHVAVCAVYTQPDRPSGRGRALKAPPVKILARERGIPVHQPADFALDAGGDAATLVAYKPDVLLVAAYGLILPQRILDIPKLMPMNVHASLLPKYRGAAPVQRAIMNGEPVTGVTIMRMEAGLDAGPILMQRAVGIGIDETAAILQEELAREGAELLVLALERLAAGMLTAIPQDAALATFAPKLTKEEGLLDFSLSGRAMHAHIRAVTPWPRAFLYLRRDGQKDLLVHVEPGCFPLSAVMRESVAARVRRADVKPGHIMGIADDALLVACGEDDWYAFTRLKPSGRNSVGGTAFFHGYLAGASGALCIGRA